jgi:hypothetical protein
MDEDAPLLKDSALPPKEKGATVGAKQILRPG